MSCEPNDAWVPIPDAGTPCVKDIGNFSCNEHNKQTGDNLTLKSIISGSFREISDYQIEHKLYIEATDVNGVVATYEPHVYVEEKNGIRERTLISFPQGYKDENGQFWIKIPDLEESCVQHASKFATNTHNKDADDNLIYVSTVDGYYYEVNPYAIRFDLRIKAKDCFGRWRIYRAIVLEDKPLTEKIRVLEYFKVIPRLR